LLVAAWYNLNIMKGFFKFICMVLLVGVLCAAFFGCDNSIKGNTEYFVYQYDIASDSFVNLGTSVKFNEDLTEFDYKFNDGSLVIHGAVRASTSPLMYTLTCGEDVRTIVLEKYRQSLVDSGADSETIKAFDIMKTGFSPTTQLLRYKNNLFKSTSVELCHVADEQSDSFEGIFMMTATGDKVRFKGGYMYATADDGNYSVKSGYYTASNGILTLTFVDNEGKDQYKNGVLYRKRYLMATVEFPADFELIGTDFEEQMTNSDWWQSIKEGFDSYAGKTISVLTDEFFSSDMQN